MVPTDDVQALVRHGVVRSHNAKGKGHAVGQFFFLQKCRSVIPVLHRSHPVVLISHASGELRRRDQYSVVIHKLHIVQPVLLSGADGIAHIERQVSVGTGEVNGHALGEVRFRYVFCLMGNFFAPLDELLLELRDQCFRALRVHGFECGLSVMRHGIGNHGYRRKYGQQDNKQQFGSEAHGSANMGYGLMISRVQMRD